MWKPPTREALEGFPEDCKTATLGIQDPGEAMDVPEDVTVGVVVPGKNLEVLEEETLEALEEKLELSEESQGALETHSVPCCAP